MTLTEPRSSQAAESVRFEAPRLEGVAKLEPTLVYVTVTAARHGQQAKVLIGVTEGATVVQNDGYTTAQFTGCRVSAIRSAAIGGRGKARADTSVCDCDRCEARTAGEGLDRSDRRRHSGTK